MEEKGDKNVKIENKWEGKQISYECIAASAFGHFIWVDDQVSEDDQWPSNESKEHNLFFISSSLSWYFSFSFSFFVLIWVHWTRCLIVEISFAAHNWAGWDTRCLVVPISTLLHLSLSHITITQYPSRADKLSSSACLPASIVTVQYGTKRYVLVEISRTSGGQSLIPAIGRVIAAKK